MLLILTGIHFWFKFQRKNSNTVNLADVSNLLSRLLNIRIRPEGYIKEARTIDQVSLVVFDLKYIKVIIAAIWSLKLLRWLIRNLHKKEICMRRKFKSNFLYCFAIVLKVVAWLNRWVTFCLVIALAQVSSKLVVCNIINKSNTILRTRNFHFGFWLLTSRGYQLTHFCLSNSLFFLFTVIQFTSEFAAPQNALRFKRSEMFLKDCNIFYKSLLVRFNKQLRFK